MTFEFTYNGISGSAGVQPEGRRTERFVFKGRSKILPFPIRALKTQK